MLVLSSWLASAPLAPPSAPVWDTIVQPCPGMSQPALPQAYLHYHDALRVPLDVTGSVRVSSTCPSRKTLRT